MRETRRVRFVLRQRSCRLGRRPDVRPVGFWNDVPRSLGLALSAPGEGRESVTGPPLSPLALEIKLSSRSNLLARVDHFCTAGT